MIAHDCAQALNEITNHPDILPGHLLDGQRGPLDVTPVLDRGGFGVLGEGYGFLLDPIAPGVVEVHTSILPEHRKRSRRITLASMDEVFTQTDTLEIVTRIKDNPAARMLALSVGMRATFERAGYEFFAIGLTQWAAGAVRFKRVGARFHRMLDAAGIESDHGEDANHDQYVGIAVAMAEGGQVSKGIWFYNQWARLAGFEPVERTGANRARFAHCEIEVTPQGARVV